MCGRYGIKGAVYLKAKDGQVLFVPEDFRPEWTGGSLSQTDEDITVNSVLGSHTYRLFDHITVSVYSTVKPLNSGPPEQGPTPEKGPNDNYASMLFLTK